MSETIEFYKLSNDVLYASIKLYELKFSEYEEELVKYQKAIVKQYDLIIGLNKENNNLYDLNGLLVDRIDGMIDEMNTNKELIETLQKEIENLKPLIM